MLSSDGSLLSPKDKNRLMKLVEEAILTNVPIENIKIIDINAKDYNI